MTHPDPKVRIPKKEYKEELYCAKTVLSPFGWGEICSRDFEAFAYGATLLKPSMEHCDTWPNVYIPNETYIPIEWDFSNIRDVFDGVGSSHYKDVARNGQKLYNQVLCSKNAKLDFAKHVVESIGA